MRLAMLCTLICLSLLLSACSHTVTVTVPPRASLTTLNAKAQVDGALRAKLQETASGATLWTNGAHGKWTIAGFHIGTQGAGSYGVTEPGKQYEAMLADLVKVATQDFRPTYQRRLPTPPG